jgi:hypothetical protein
MRLAADADIAAAKAAGLRKLADMIEHTPELVDMTSLTRLYAFHARKPGDHALLARAALRHGAIVDKDINDQQYNLLITWAPGVSTYLLADRNEVCERIKVGEETITRTVLDPDALATVPEVEVTECVDIYEWQCTPLLGETGEQS